MSNEEACEFCGCPKTNTQQSPPTCANIHLCRYLVLKRATELEARLARALALVGHHLLVGTSKFESLRELQSILSSPTAESGPKYEECAERVTHERAMARYVHQQQAQQAEGCSLLLRQHGEVNELKAELAAQGGEREVLLELEHWLRGNVNEWMRLAKTTNESPVYQLLKRLNAVRFARLEGVVR